MNVDIRKVGIWMLGVGCVAASVGLVGDAVRHANDPTLSSRQGIFDLSGWPHALFFGGICLALIGLFTMLVGPEIYKPGSKLTVGRRLAQVGVPLAAVVLVAGCAAITSNSTFADPSADPHAVADAVAASGATTDTTAASGHSHDETAATGATGDTGATAAADADSHGTVIAGTATGKSPCEVASPTPASPGQVGAGEGGSATAADPAGEHGGRGMLVQTPLTKAERVLLEQQMAQARTVIAKYPTAKDAVAAGYRMSTPYVPCIGAHYTNFGLVAKFDPAAPSELLYDGTEARLEDRRPELPRVPPRRPAGRFRGHATTTGTSTTRTADCASARAAPSSAAKTRPREECAARGGAKTRAHRHLDGARVGRARVRVQLGRVRR